MKIKNLLCYSILPLLLYITSIKPESFFPNKLVKTTLDSSCVEQLKSRYLILFYALDNNHLVNNTIPVVVVYFPVIIAKAIPVIQTCLTAATTFLGVHFAKKAQHKLRASSLNSSSSNNYSSYYPDPNDPNNDKNKSNNKEHPHGIYKDADYHHKNSTNRKSPCPDNGQRCLDYSIQVGEQRIAIEGDHFVVLRLTRPGEYHGFKVSWNKLDDKLQAALIKNGFVRKTGKIICQITEKF